jgi:hypothetical protein
MELLLNLAWVVLAAGMVCLWLRYAPRNGADRRMQMVSLAVLIFVLLPAISMTDDLLAAQNPAEVDSSLRRDHKCFSPHSIFPSVATLPLSVFDHAPLRAASLLVPHKRPEPVVYSPALSSIQNRPPPSC